MPLWRAVPGLLGSRIHFKKQFSDPVEHGQRHTATKRELATGRKAMQKLAKKMSGWFLRRTKTLIKDQLPKKEDRVRIAIISCCLLFFSWKKLFLIGNISPVVFYEYRFLVFFAFYSVLKKLYAELQKTLIEVSINFTNLLANRFAVSIH